MHNIDRTLQELETGAAQQGEFENYESGTGYGQELEYGHEYSQEFEANQGENQELEMAYQLLEVGSQQELNQFLGGLMNRAVSAVQGATAAAQNAATRFVASPTGQAVGQYLVNVGEKTLPQLGAKYGSQYGEKYGGQYGGQLGGSLGGALGGQFGLGGAGRAAGQSLGKALGGAAGGALGGYAGNWAASKAGTAIASNARRIFNLELAGLSPENQELEIARSYVRFASDVARRAHQTARQYPQLRLGQVGRRVLGASARQYAPGLLRGGLLPGYRVGYNGYEGYDGYDGGEGDDERFEVNPGQRPASGTWERRGSRIILHNA